MTKKLLSFIFLVCIIPSYSIADYPNTSIGVIDLNRILAEADAAVMAAKQIEEIASDIQKEIADSDKVIIDEQNQLIESQAIMAPEAFESKRAEYENKIEKYNAERPVSYTHLTLPTIYSV